MTLAYKKNPLSYVLDLRVPVPMSPEALPFGHHVTVDVPTTQYVTALGGPVQYDPGCAYTNAAIVPWWVVLVVAMRSRPHPNVVHVHDPAFDTNTNTNTAAARAFKRGATDADWAAALVMAWAVGGRTAARKFINTA